MGEGVKPMMTAVRQTSILAYISLTDLGARQRVVLETIKHIGKACNLDIATYLHTPINSITPRTNELVDKGLVEISHKATCPQTGRKAIYWVAK